MSLPRRDRTARKSTSSFGAIIARLLTTLVALVVIVGVAGGALWLWATSDGPLPEDRVVNIPAGSTSQEIASTLEREGVVFAIHSDHSLVLTPINPLAGVWIAVSGRIFTSAAKADCMAAAEGAGVAEAGTASASDAEPSRLTQILRDRVCERDISRAPLTS